MYFIGEGDGLVCRRGFFLAGKGAKEIPELFRISAVVRFGEGILPLLLGMFGYSREVEIDIDNIYY